MIDKCLTKAAGELGVEEVSEADAKAIADTNSQTLSNVIFLSAKARGDTTNVRWITIWPPARSC